MAEAMSEVIATPVQLVYCPHGVSLSGSEPCYDCLHALQEDAIARFGLVKVSTPTWPEVQSPPEGIAIGRRPDWMA